MEAKTTGGWVSMCCGAAWSWAVETMRLQVLSSTEAEYCETANAAGVSKTTNMSVTCPGADPSTMIQPGGHTNPVDPNLAPPLGPQGVTRAHL